MKNWHLRSFLLSLIIPYILAFGVANLQLLEIEEDYFFTETEIFVGDGMVIQQKIVPRYANLFRVDLLLKKSQPHVQGVVNLHFTSEQDPSILLGASLAWATPHVKDGIYPFVFSPPINAISQTLILSISTNTDTSVITFGTQVNRYPDGELMSVKTSAVQDLAFRLYYRPGIINVLRQGGLPEVAKGLSVSNFFQSIQHFGLAIALPVSLGLYFFVLITLVAETSRINSK